MKANRFAKNDEGVSAVIGVILMVAITVILAAVIAAFVFGMVGGVNQKKNPAFTIKRTGVSTADLTFSDFGGASTIANLTCTSGGTCSASSVDIGDVLSVTALSSATGCHVIFTAEVDGNPQIVLDTTI